MINEAKMKVEVHLNGEKYIDFENQQMAEDWIKNYNDNARYKKNFIIKPVGETTEPIVETFVPKTRLDIIRRAAEADRRDCKNDGDLRWTNDDMLIVLDALDMKNKS
jgi:hypothetical protein